LRPSGLGDSDGKPPGQRSWFCGVSALPLLQKSPGVIGIQESEMEKIMVCLKRVVDYNVRIRIKPDGSGVITDGVKMSINPFDEIALEEALRLREKDKAKEVFVVSIGPSDCQQQLRTGLAMGADRAILVETDTDIEPLASARVFQQIIDKEKPDLVILGKQAIDDDCNQTGQMLATLWNRPQATFASGLEITDSIATVTREVDAGLEVIEVDLPAVVTTDLRLNEPRYVKLPDIMKAKKKPMETIAIADLGVDTTPMFETTGTEAPPVRQKGVLVNDVAELVSALKQKGFLT
jgi:electron transfer flavoprotein beta subunit